MHHNLGFDNSTRYGYRTKFRYLEAMDDLVRIRDESGQIIFENKTMRDMIESSIINHTHYIKSSDLFFDLYSSSIKHKATIDREIQIDDKIYLAKASPVFDSEDNVEAYIEVYRDVTYEKNAARDLLASNNKLAHDIKLANTIQKSILPKRNKFRNLHFEFEHKPSEDLSGDVFDVVDIDRDRVGVYIADVVGHGISSSMMTMFIRQGMRRILQENGDLSPEETILELKSMFRQLDLNISQYFSIVYMLIDTSKNELTYVNAGHNTFPILFNSKGMAFLQNKGKLISNLFKDVSYNEKTIQLNSGDKILLYTDGLTETTNEKGEVFNESRLYKWIRNHRNEKNLAKKLVEDVSSFRYREQKDDIAVVYLEVRG